MGHECEHGVSGEPCPDCIKEYHAQQALHSVVFISFSYRDESTEVQHGRIPVDAAGEMIGDLLTKLHEYTAWVKQVPGA